MMDEAPDIETRQRDPHANDEVCNDILLGLKPRPFVDLWLEHFSHCESCERRFQRLAAELEIVRSRPMPQVRRQRWQISTRMRSPAAFAAAVTVVLLVGLWQGRLDNGPAGDFWLPTQQQEINLRSELSEGARSFEQAMQAYGRHDAEEAIRQLRVPLSNEGYDLMRRVYLASALLEGGEPQEALEVLQQLQVHTLPQPWKNRSLWVQYGCLKQLGDKQRAQSLLERLTRDPGPIGQRARKASQ